MQRALRLAQKGSKGAIVGGTRQAARVFKLARYGSILAKRMVVIDLAFRVHNVAQATGHRGRAVAGEVAGFAASTYFGTATYTACLAPAAAFTGPWALAICLIPAAGVALATDKGFKHVGEEGYDLAASFLD